ncbi:MAG: ASKHA domain-containing protein [Oscillospiraceae bacterium]|nr:ASKHA domain-containing protein [Oscillospiraceae bacterium]
MIKLSAEYQGKLLCEAAALPLPCGGRRKCGNCRVLARGALEPAGPEERKILENNQIPPPAGYEWRLACFCRIKGEAELLLPERIALKEQRFEELPEYDGNAVDSCGLAVDVGTTTITMQLFRFADHLRIATVHEMNRQSAYGADVLSRIATGKHRELSKCLHEQLRDMLRQSGVAPKSVSRAVITGNSAMLHYIAALNPDVLGVYPFAPRSLFGTEILADWLPKAKAYLPPCASAFVGADAICGAYATRLQQRGNALLIDVGTNGEMIFNANGRLLGCSVAAGPAFEGAEISMGMPALPGAVDRVWGAAGRLCWHSIPGAAVRGICGTGLLGALRFFLERGTIDRAGTIVGMDEDPYLIWNGDAPSLWLGDSGIVVTQDDVRKLQQAKAAVAAGIIALLQYSGKAKKEIKKLFFAGGFGGELAPEDAAAIGMMPVEMVRIAESVGNCALQGAARLLFSTRERAVAEQIAKSIEVLPLATDEVFQNEFINAMSF